MAHNTKFTESELEEIAARHAENDATEDVAADGWWDVDDGQSATGSTTMTVRMPVSMVATLKARAERDGIGATVLARQLIAQGLAGESDLGSVSVADILTLARSPASRDEVASGDDVSITSLDEHLRVLLKRLNDVWDDDDDAAARFRKWLNGTTKSGVRKKGTTKSGTRAKR